MEARGIYERLERQFPGKVSGFHGDVLDPYLHVDSQAIVEICRFLRDTPELKFETLSDLTALDLPKEDNIQVVYHLYSYSERHQIVLKVDLPRENPRVSTMKGV